MYMDENKVLKNEIKTLKISREEQEKGFVKAFYESRQIIDSPVNSS